MQIKIYKVLRHEFSILQDLSFKIKTYESL